MLPEKKRISRERVEIVRARGRSQANEQSKTGQTFHSTTLSCGDTAILPGRKRARILRSLPGHLSRIRLAQIGMMIRRGMLDSDSLVMSPQVTTPRE